VTTTQRVPSNKDPLALARTAAIFRAARERRLARIEREAAEAELQEAS